MNNDLQQTNPKGVYVTSIVGSYNSTSDVVELSNAGHLPALFKNGNGFHEYESSSLPLGVKKANNKIYYRHTGYPGGIKETTPNKMKEKNKSDEMIKLAIKRMIPRGPLGRQQLSNCKIYRDENHKHEAQNPQIIDIASMNTKNKI